MLSQNDGLFGKNRSDAFASSSESNRAPRFRMYAVEPISVLALAPKGSTNPSGAGLGGLFDLKLPVEGRHGDA